MLFKINNVQIEVESPKEAVEIIKEYEKVGESITSSKKCPICGDMFKPKHQKQVYCSDECYGVANKKQQKKYQVKQPRKPRKTLR